MQWFRFYQEFSSDPKVQMMPESYQRRLVMLLCFRCNGDVTLQDEEVTFQLRISPEEWCQTKAEFIKRGFIDSDNKLLNWDKRQFASDQSNQRVKKYREKMKQECNVTVTPPDTEQNRTEQIDITPEFEKFWASYPKQRAGSRTKAEAAYRQALKRASVAEILSGLENYVVSSEVAKGYAKGAAAWLNDDRWANVYAKEEKKFSEREFAKRGIPGIGR